MPKEMIADTVARQEELQGRLFKLIQQDPPNSIKKVAKEIGIDVNTLGNFLRGRKRVRFITLLKIEKYVCIKEKLFDPSKPTFVLDSVRIDEPCIITVMGDVEKQQTIDQEEKKTCLEEVINTD